MRKEAKRANAIVHAHQHHALVRQVLAVVDGGGGGAEGEPAAVDPDEHGDTFTGGLRRGPDVHVKAVLADVPLAVTLVRVRPELVGRSHALPLHGRLRRAPAEVADRRRGKRDAAVDGQVLLGDALHEPVFGQDGGGLLGEARRGGAEGEEKDQIGLHSQKVGGDGSGIGREGWPLSKLIQSSSPGCWGVATDRQGSAARPGSSGSIVSAYRRPNSR